MFTLEYAKNPEYISNDGQQIFLIVKFEEIGEELPFNATSFDPMPHGVDLWQRATAGEFGPVAPYVAPPEPTQPTVNGAQTL